MFTLESGIKCPGSNVHFGVRDQTSGDQMSGDQMSILVSGIKSPGIKCPGIKCPFLGWGSKVRGSNVRGSNVHFGVGDQKSGDQMSILGSGIKRHQDQMSILCRGSNVLGIECPRDQLSTHFMGSKIRNQKSGDQKSGDQVSITHIMPLMNSFHVLFMLNILRNSL